MMGFPADRAGPADVVCAAGTRGRIGCAEAALRVAAAKTAATVALTAILNPGRGSLLCVMIVLVSVPRVSLCSVVISA
jgi:hypothetical protein